MRYELWHIIELYEQKEQKALGTTWVNNCLHF